MLLPIDASDRVIATHEDKQLDRVVVAYPDAVAIRRIIEGVAVMAGQPDPTIEHPEYLTDLQPNEVQTAQEDYAASVPEWLRTWTAEEINTYIDTHVTDLASARTALKHIGLALTLIRKILLSK